MLITPSPDFVRSVMNNDRVWNSVRADGYEKSDFSWDADAVYFQYADAGFLMFRPVNRWMSEIHIACSRTYPGIEEFIQSALAEMRARGFIKFLAPIGAWNRAARSLAKRCGFEIEGEISSAYVRDGRRQSMIYMGSP
jgi:hypothetical protein